MKSLTSWSISSETIEDYNPKPTHDNPYLHFAKTMKLIGKLPPFRHLLAKFHLTEIGQNAGF